jgi:hypothetical protein
VALSFEDDNETSGDAQGRVISRIQATGILSTSVLH